MNINYLAVVMLALTSVVIAMVEHRGQGERKIRTYVFSLIGALLTSLIFAVLINASRLLTLFGIIPLGWEPICVALVVWIGFFLPEALGQVAWKKKTVKESMIHAVYELGKLVLMALIFWWWKP